MLILFFLSFFVLHYLFCPYCFYKEKEVEVFFVYLVIFSRQVSHIKHFVMFSVSKFRLKIMKKIAIPG